MIICQDSVKSSFFCICNRVVFSEMKNKWKISEKSWKNSWRERKKSYLCTRKTTGTTVNGKMEVVWRSSLNEWSKQSLKGKEVHKKRTLSILADRSGRDRIIYTRISNLQWRVWSWLRMNASGRPNTCKSNGKRPFGAVRVAHGCVTRMQPTQCWRIARRNSD